MDEKRKSPLDPKCEELALFSNKKESLLILNVTVDRSVRYLEHQCLKYDL